jgi:hypothetical protein
MRPSRLVLTLAAALLLAPLSASAGKGGGGGGGKGTFPEGEYFYIDRVSVDKIKSLAVIDQAFDEFCLTALIVFLDTTTTLNHRVEFIFHSLGDIEKESDSTVDGVFTSVDLTLNVYSGPETTDTLLFSNTVTSFCELDARLTKAGQRLKALLECELGPNLVNMGVTLPDTDGILDSVAFALAKKKSVKIDIDTGDFRVFNNGIEVNPVADGLDFTRLSCPTSSDDDD